MPTSLDKQYDPKKHESKIYAQWESSGAFAPNQAALQAGQEPYTIMLPPPNITGSLHIGHALQDTIMDILARYHRLHGRPVLWQPGTDHAAIATNKVIENQLHDEGKTRHDIGREAFLERTEEWYANTSAEILNQMKRLGCSCDWDRSRFTMDERYVAAVTQAFIRYHERGYIYRGARIVNWDPTTQTTVSDLEIDYHTETTPFYYFKYGPFEIGTARPETKFGDKYIVVHPTDERFAQYQHGETFETEWINGPITATIIKDEAADPAVGSGAMTITPWHSAIDFEIAQRHNLDSEQIIDFDGKLLPIAGEFAGQDIETARPKIVAKLKDKGLLVRADENYEHNLARNDRGKGTIEPQVMRQWFVDMQKLKADTITAVENDEVAFLPTRWRKHFLKWMHEVHDWNINRQIWLGHRLPVWWKQGTHGTSSEEGNYVIATEKPAGDYEQDPDTLDTWFSSALWPFATLGWPESTADLKTFYPTTVLVTARDILYLWVARMIFSGLALMQGEEYGNRDQLARLPFRDVFIHPTVLTKDGKRMSKSLGTGIDPLELIDEYGADATRFGLMYQMSYDAQAIKFDTAAITSGRNFANKLWNIARFLESLDDTDEPTPADHWIQQRQAAVTAEVETLLAEYKFGEAVRTLYAFIWNDFADWYLEILKTGGSTQTARSVFTAILHLVHPVMPHVTEVIWQATHDKQGQLMESTWPTAAGTPADPAIDQAIAEFKDIVTTTRSARTLLSIPPGATIKLHVPSDHNLTSALASLTRATLVDAPPATAKNFPLASGRSVAIASEHITPESLAAAREKLTAEIDQTEKWLAAGQASLEKMRAKAPEKVVTEKEASLTAAKQRRQQLQNDLKLLEN